MNKQQLANKIWESANRMRSKIEANEYKDYILGFIFYRYLSDMEIKFLKENDFSVEDIKRLSGNDQEIIEYVQKNIGYFIAYDDLFSTWIGKGKDFDVSNVRDALSAFNRLIYGSHKKVFEKIFDTLQTGLSKLGDSSGSQTKAISGLLQLIKDIPMEGKPDNIVTRNGDTLEEDWPYFDDNDPINTYNPLYVDAVVSNPPYSQVWDPSNKEADPRYARFGLAPKGKADYAFLLHDLFHVKPDGIMTIVLPHGVLFRGGEEGEIRKNLIENNHIDAIIGLPANIFFGTGIPTVIIVLKQKRDDTDVLIIDASKGFIKEGKNNKLRASDIKRISDVVAERISTDKFSRVVSREEIRQNEYNLNIPRYVDTFEKAETWDIYASMFGGIPKAEIDELKDVWAAFPNLKTALFKDTGTPYVTLAIEDIKATIKGNDDVTAFEASFDAAFESFAPYLRSELFDKISDLIISQEENILSDDIFKRLQGIPLIDKYEAYQLLDDEWNKIAIDLEIIHTEGFEATKKVDPNIVIKKKEGRDQEIQEGWVGRILPFELVQSTLLKPESDALKNKENRLAEIPSEYDEILDSMTEDEKESCKDMLTQDGDAFIAKELSKKLKELKELKTERPGEEIFALLEKLTKAEGLIKEEKELKVEVKKDSATLHSLTKETIETLSDSQVLDLIDKKWIESLILNIYKLPDTIVDNLTGKIIELQKKYETTYFQIEEEIKETVQHLFIMIDQLEGNEYDMKGLSEFKSLLMCE